MDEVEGRGMDSGERTGGIAVEGAGTGRVGTDRVGRISRSGPTIRGHSRASERRKGIDPTIRGMDRGIMTAVTITINIAITAMCTIKT